MLAGLGSGDHPYSHARDADDAKLADGGSEPRIVSRLLGEGRGPLERFPRAIDARQRPTIRSYSALASVDCRSYSSTVD